MKWINRILVALDGSKDACKALECAIDLAEKYGANIELLTVIPTTAFTLVGPSEKELKERAEEILEQALNKTKTKPSLKISTKILVGRPAEKIVEASKEGSFDLIVMGSQGLGGVKEFFLGSVADRVADESACPVIIVK